MDKYNEIEDKYSFNYLGERYKISGNQFKNILLFLSIFSNDYEKLYNMSPDYIIEKYIKYIGDPCLIKDEKMGQSGIHKVLFNRFILKYFRRWANVDHADFFINSNISTDNFINDV
jgi:hypothetical protein